MTIQVRSTEPSHKNRKCPYLGKRLTVLTRLGMWMDTRCGSIILKKIRTIEVRSAEILPLYWEVLRLGVKRLGLRCTALSCFP